MNNSYTDIKIYIIVISLILQLFLYYDNFYIPVVINFVDFNPFFVDGILLLSLYYLNQHKPRYVNLENVCFFIALVTTVFLETISRLLCREHSPGGPGFMWVEFVVGSYLTPRVYVNQHVQIPIDHI